MHYPVFVYAQNGPCQDFKQLPSALFSSTFLGKERWTFKKSGKFDFLKVHQEK